MANEEKEYKTNEPNESKENEFDEQNDPKEMISESIREWKMKHLHGLQIIQAFAESWPQFLLQTVAVFADWTSGTGTQCFPGEYHQRYCNITQCFLAE